MDSKSLTKKLYIKPTFRVGVFNAPDVDFEKLESALSDNEVFSEITGVFDLFLLFINDKVEFEANFKNAVFGLKDNRQFWIAYPKQSAKIKTDITREVLHSLLKEFGYEGISMVSLDKDWSAMRFKKSRK